MYWRRLGFTSCLHQNHAKCHIQYGLRRCVDLALRPTRIGYGTAGRRGLQYHTQAAILASIFVRSAQGKPARKHRGKHAVLEDNMMVEPGEGMESREPQDRIAEPRVDRCDRRARIV